MRAYALQALETGEALLLRILPFGDEAEIGPEGREVASEDGAVTVENPCLSGGAIEVFLEPVVPAPRVLVVGDTPIAGAVLRLGAELGLDAVAADGDALDPRPGDLALVVAAHGRDELHALRRGLEAGLPYVGLVASAKRGDGVLGELRGDGVPSRAARPDRRARRHRHRRAHPGGDRPVDPRRGRRGTPAATGRAAASHGRRPDLRDDRRRRGRHALAPARRRDRLLLLRGLQGQVRAWSTSMPPSD